jgi:hypothetical protein
LLGEKLMIKVPADFPVQPLGPDDKAKDRATCGTCGLSWDDGVSTEYTPTPAGRCPFERFHSEGGWEHLISDLTDDQSDVLIEALDEQVHEHKACEATEINNGGLASQLQYLHEKLGDKGLKDLLGELTEEF